MLKTNCNFLDPVGSLVSTLLVGGLLVVGHTFSKFVNFVKLRQGSGKDRQGMALKVKGLKA